MKTDLQPSGPEGLNDIPILRDPVLKVIYSEIDAYWNSEILIDVQEEVYLLNACLRIDIVSHKEMDPRAVPDVLVRERMDLDPLRSLTPGEECGIKSRGIRSEHQYFTPFYITLLSPG
jgi:hypothetical protein